MRRERGQNEQRKRVIRRGRWAIRGGSRAITRDRVREQNGYRLRDRRARLRELKGHS